MFGKGRLYSCTWLCSSCIPFYFELLQCSYTVFSVSVQFQVPIVYNGVIATGFNTNLPQNSPTQATYLVAPQNTNQRPKHFYETILTMWSKSYNLVLKKIQTNGPHPPTLLPPSSSKITKSELEQSRWMRCLNHKVMWAETTIGFYLIDTHEMFPMVLLPYAFKNLEKSGFSNLMGYLIHNNRLLPVRILKYFKTLDKLKLKLLISTKLIIDS